MTTGRLAGDDAAVGVDKSGLIAPLTPGCWHQARWWWPVTR
jgi:hypothetical protein